MSDADLISEVRDGVVSDAFFELYTRRADTTEDDAEQSILDLLGSSSAELARRTRRAVPRQTREQLAREIQKLNRDAREQFAREVLRTGR